MHWNHRIVRVNRTGVGDGPVLQFADVYYHDETNELMSWSDPFMVGDTIEEMKEMADRLQRATLLPIIDDSEFPNHKE